MVFVVMEPGHQQVSQRVVAGDDDFVPDERVQSRPQDELGACLRPH